MWDAILSKCKPIIIAIGKCHMPYSRKQVTGLDYYRHRENILPGDCLLTKTGGELSNVVNPEDIKHAALYVGDVHGDGVRYVIEATSKGVKYTDLVTFMTTKDLVICCRPNFLDTSSRNEVGYFAKDYLGKPYDYTFTKGSTAFYCFELVAKVYEDMGLGAHLSMKEVVKNKSIYSCDTFYGSSSFTNIFDTRDTE